MSTDPESVSWLRFAMASVTVIGLMALLAWMLKYVSMRGWLAAKPNANRRLKLVETLPLDARRRLVIIQCDDVEYILLLGLNQDTVVASDLTKAVTEK